MICHFYGNPISTNELRKMVDIARIGMTFGAVEKICKILKFQAVVVRGKSEQLSKAKFPAIIHWRNNHFVVLEKIKKGKKGVSFIIADPSNGRMCFTERDFSLNWSKSGIGTAMFLYPDTEFFERNPTYDKNNSVVLKLLVKQLLKRKKILILSLLLLLFAMGLNWAIPYLYQSLLDKGVLAKDMSKVWSIFIAQLLFFIGYFVSSGLSSIILSKVNFNVGIDFLGQILNKIVSLPMYIFESRVNTDFIQRLSDYYSLESFLTDKVINIIFSVINVIVFISLLFLYSKFGFLIFIVLSLCGWGWSNHFLQQHRSLNYSKFTEQAYNKNILSEIIWGMGDIKVNNAQQQLAYSWTQNQSRINDISLSVLKVNYKINFVKTAINKFRDLFVFVLCAKMTINGSISVGALLSISYILGQLSSPVNQLQYINYEFQLAIIAMNRLARIHLKESESICTDIMDISFKSKISFSKITFQYPGSFNSKLFNKLDVCFPRGKTTAIVGNSGSGKSTMIKLLLGFYEPNLGEVLIDDKSLKTINLDKWRDKCGVVLQDSKIFSGTVAFNISLGYDNSDIDRIIECASLARIDNEIEKLPGKYYAPLGNTGIELSKGQQQRIIIARAIYRNPEILIFDEATSSLDTINERRIMDNLKAFFKDRTVIVVAHRLSTVVNADNIIYLEEGRIAEQGTHKDLVAKRGKYYELIKNQLEIEN